MGKIKTKDLANLLKCVKKTSQVIVPPMPGFDSGAHEIGDNQCLVVSTDPCIGVPKEWFGWFLIHYAASDVAIFGARPQYAAINLLGPPTAKISEFNKIMKQACEAADDLKINIITGHTGTYNTISTMLGTCTAYGLISRDRLITPARAKSGDYLICTKPLGLETLVNFALTNKRLAIQLFGRKEALKLARQVKMQTCVSEALLLAETGGVTAMHDATEGGFVAALNEIADASNIGFSIDFAELQIPPQLNQLAKYFNLTQEEILATSSTGTLLAAVSPHYADKAIDALSKIGLSSKVVGLLTKNKERLIKINGEESPFPRKASDPYARIMAQ